MKFEIKNITVALLFLIAAPLATVFIAPDKAFADITHLGVPNMTGLTSGLVGWWPFDGDNTDWRTNTTQDVSGNGNTGTMVGMSTTTSPKAGKIGQALKFDGSTSYVDAGDISAMNGLSQVTVATWIKASSSGANSSGAPSIVSKESCGAGTRGPFNLNVDSGNATFVVFSGGTNYGSNFGTSNIDDGKWHFVIGEYDGSYVSIWVDGTKENYNTVGAVTLDSTTNHFEIGNCFNTARYYNGAIDDVRVYNRALSTQEIQQLYHLGTVKISPSR